MRFNQTVRFVSVWIFLLGFLANVLAQGNGHGRVRVLRVRKTGEFGKRIEPISTFYQPPTRHFRANEPSLETAETRRPSDIVGVPKPSQQLQLPFYNQVERDQESEESVESRQETVESPQGYAYPSAPKKGYSYKPPPVAEYPNQGSDEEQQSLDEAPSPVSPVIEAEQTAAEQGSPFAVQTEENIDADQREAPAEAPVPVQDTPNAELSAKCDEHDHDCWPHGYGGEIPGEAGTDYPILSEIVDTPFECDNVQYSGYYADADEQARCQIFHICLKGNQYRKTQKWSFLCPNGTVFSQNDFVCVWWNSAPECNSQVVDELSLRNAELGWDNLTETGSNNGGGSSNFDVRTAMSNLFNANLQPSSSNSRLKNTLPEPTTTRRPYRVPVKVNTGSGARTQLKEVTNNGLQGQYQDGFEHEGEESEAYETSLSQQSEARRKSKTASALLKSESEAYEQKSVPDSVKPFIVQRTPVGSDQSPSSIPQQGEYEDEEEVPSLVMMQTQQRNPDGSDGFAEVPVMMSSGGYRYPNPNSTPGPEYLPPRNEYAEPSTTEPPTTTTQSPVTEESYEAEGGYPYQTTEEPSEPAFSPQIPVTTEQPGYKYPNPTTTDASGYDYPSPSTTEESGYNYPTPTTTEETGYNYPAPTTTEQSGYSYQTPTSTTGASYQEEEFSSPVYEEQQGGYERESTTASRVPDRVAVTERQTTTAPEVTTTETKAPIGGYLPPKTEGGYDSPSPRAVASLKAAADVIALPNTDNSEGNKSNPTAPDSSEYVDDGTDLTTLSGNEISGGYEDKETTLPYHIPTPASGTVGGTGENLDAQQAKVDDILKQIQSGGAEVRDESGNKVDFEILKKLLSSPSGLLALQKADSAVTPDSSTSSSTEVPTTDAAIESETPEEQTPTLESVQTIEDFKDDNTAPVQQTYVDTTPQVQPTYFSTQEIPQQSYFSNDRAVNIQHPTFAIKAPSKEFESHTVQQNSIASGLSNQNEGYSKVLSQQYQPQQGYHQTQIAQTFAPAQHTSNELSYQPQQTNYQQQQNYPSPVEYVRPSVPQPENYYQSQPQLQQSPQQPTVSQPNAYYQTQQQEPQRQIQNNFQPAINQNYQQQQPQQQFFAQPETARYLPPPVSTSQSQIYSPAPTQSRAPTPPPRDLTNNIQLQQSFAYPVSQSNNPSQNSRQLSNNPLDIKIVPAVFVHQHTRVENPDGSPIQSSASERTNIYQRPNYNNNNEQRLAPQSNYNNNNNAQLRQYSPYASQTENRPVTVRAPRSRYDNYPNSEAYPKYEPFTAEDGRTAEQIQQYHHADLRKFQPTNVRPTQAASSSTYSSSLPLARRNGRHYIASSGSRGELEMPSEQSSISNTFPGRDRSLGVSLTYN